MPSAEEIKAQFNAQQIAERAEQITCRANNRDREREKKGMQGKKGSMTLWLTSTGGLHPDHRCTQTPSLQPKVASTVMHVFMEGHAGGRGAMSSD